MSSRPCTWCGSLEHTQFYCYRKARKPIARSSRPIPRESAKAKTKRIITYKQWMKLNPPDETGHWDCYLQISIMCPKRLTRALLTQEHVVPKVKAPELKYDPNNIRPSCTWCNKLKGSRTIEQLAKIWPHLEKYLT